MCLEIVHLQRWVVVDFLDFLNFLVGGSGDKRGARVVFSLLSVKVHGTKG